MGLQETNFPRPAFPVIEICLGMRASTNLTVHPGVLYGRGHRHYRTDERETRGEDAVERVE